MDKIESVVTTRVSGTMVRISALDGEGFQIGDFQVDANDAEDAVSLLLGAQTTEMVGVPAFDGSAQWSVDKGKGLGDLWVTEIGSKKIAAIKAVRDIVPGMGLKDGKDLVESCPFKLPSLPSRADQDKAQRLLIDAGCTVEIRERA